MTSWGDSVRRFLLLAALVLVAAPLEAQKKVKHDPYKISSEELAEYGEATLIEVIPRARPNFLMANGGGGQMLAEQTVSGMAAQIVVYVGTLNQGDSSVLRFYKASDVKEVRYFKPGNSLSPQTAGNSFVIQLLMKDRLKQEKF
jgi:rRNA pseudouridine-1189 N-methylase Emg1 (Nep1/Mra1 family)